MKKILSLILTLTMVLSFALTSFAVSSVQPYAPGTMSTECFRIPAIITLKNGTVLCAGDMRNTTGTDSPGNLDTLVSLWDGSDLSYVKVNSFDDAPDGVDYSGSASYIDSAVVQSQATDRIFIITSTFLSGYGNPNAKKGSGMTEDGKHIILTNKGDTDKKKDYTCYVGDFSGDYAPVVGAEEYSVDRNYCLYKNGEALYVPQKCTGVQVKQSIFYDSSAFHVYPTSFLTLKYSDDNGETWSYPVILNTLKKDSEAFFGACPGRGALTTVNGRERVLFCVYDNGTLTEKASTVYSDDNGLTWHRGEHIMPSVSAGKTSETQLINCPDGSLKAFTRNKSRYVGVAVSTDGGETFSTARLDRDLYCTKNCMVSFINTSHVIGGKQVVLGSFACGGNDRKDGVIRTGLMDGSGDIEWIKTYHINKGFFAYSCLTELQDGTIACLYEDGPYQITLGIFNLDGEGNITSVDGDDIVYEDEDLTFFQKVARFFEELYDKLFGMFKIVC